MNDARMAQRLAPPEQWPVDVVVDSDAYNEVDDQFALAFAALSAKINLRAVYAAPFYNDRSTGPADGMRKSHGEILRVLACLAGRYRRPEVFMGAESFMPAARTPVESPATRDLIARALAQPPERPLYVAAIGCPVNVASALLLCPEIARRLVVVWLGGHASTLSDSSEFNLMQDLYSSQALLDTPVPLVRMPCNYVATHLAVSPQELRYHIGGAGELGRYLCGIVQEALGQESPGVAAARVIWDIITIAWIVNPAAVPTVLVHSPRILQGGRLSVDSTRHLQREAYAVNRAMVLSELFTLINDNVK